MEKLRGAGVGVECRGRMVTALLYADDAVLLAENEEQVKRGLKVLEEWCKEWAVEVNVEKSGVMHIRRKGVKRTVETFLLMMRGLELWRSISIWGVWLMTSLIVQGWWRKQRRREPPKCPFCLS